MKKVVCPVPKCSTVCNKNELHLHVSQNHATEVIQMKYKLPLGQYELNQQSLSMSPPPEQPQRQTKMSPPIKKEIIPTSVSSSPASRGPLQQIAHTQLPAGFPCNQPHLFLPSDNLSQSMQPSETLVQTMQTKAGPPVFPTYGQQPVFPGGGRWAPEQQEALNLASGSGSECGSESSELKPESDIFIRSQSPETQERERRDSGNSTWASDSPESGEKETRNVAADSTSMAPKDESEYSRQHEPSDIIQELARAAGITLSNIKARKDLVDDEEDIDMDEKVSLHNSPEKESPVSRKRKLDEYEDEAEQIGRIVTALVQSKSDARLVLKELSRQGHLFNCSHCNIFFPEYSTYVLHRSCHENNTPFTCHFCHAVFPDKFGFLTHFMHCAKMKAEKA